MAGLCCLGTTKWNVGDTEIMMQKRMLLGRKRALFLLGVVALILLSSGVFAELDLKITGTLNQLSADFHAQTNTASLNGYDGYDLPSPTAPSNYSRFYSRICASGTTCTLAFDSWKASDNPRTLNLTYQATPAQTGTLALSWSYSDSNYQLTLTDYGDDSTYASAVSSGIDLSSQSSYSVAVSSMTFRYFTLAVTNVTSSGGTTTGTSGGGGGGGTTTGTTGGALTTGTTTGGAGAAPFLHVPTGLSFSSVVGSKTTRTFEIENTEDKELTLEVVVLGLVGTIEVPSQIHLAPKEKKTITVDIGALQNGLQTGTIVFFKGNKPLIVPLVLNVKSENFLFDAAVTLSETARIVHTGDSLTAQIALQQVGPKQKVDVTVLYVIKDFSGKSYLEDSETFSVYDAKGLSKEFPTKGLPPGKYILGLEVFYPGAFATSSAQFEVTEKKGLDTYTLLILTVAVLFIGGIVTVIISLRRRITVRRLHGAR